MDTNGTWEPLGETPLTGQFLPFGFFHVRVSKAGYAPAEITMAAANPRHMTLTPEAAAPPRMVLITPPGNVYAVGVAKQVALPDYWLDKFEVTNAEFKQFVEAGGYRDAKYWKDTFRDGARRSRFRSRPSRDSATQPAGRARPSWQLGSYPEGQADFPVGGISWFEAQAYAQFVGKRLPTIYHWYRAANPEDLFADILRVSNFDSRGPVKVGERAGLGPWGTLDMAGNVKEWCANGANDESMRYILGGGWNEPNYRYTEADARNPWERAPTFGVRLMKDREERPAGAIDDTTAPIAQVYGDPKSVVPVSDALFEVYRRFYAYDRSRARREDRSRRRHASLLASGDRQLRGGVRR